MKILGISEIDNDAGAALFVDSELVAAANEERFSRVKQHDGFPTRAVEWMLRVLLSLLVAPAPDRNEAQLRRLLNRRLVPVLGRPSNEDGEKR